MTDFNSPSEPDQPEDDLPPTGQVQLKNLSARLPEHVGAGVFSNGVLILTGPFEVICDFVLRMGENQRIISRIVLPHAVARQFVSAMRDNVANYEKRFGPLPAMPKPLPEPREELIQDEPHIASALHETPVEAAPPAPPPAPAAAEHPENRPEKPHNPPIEDIYHDLRLGDDMLSGRYANAVLIRHSGTEFCFDFITNFYPRSAISARVFLAAPHVGPFLASLTRSVPGAPRGDG